MNKRIKDISARLQEYSLGNFDNILVLSPNLDEVDAISNSINMLGEELKEITISKNYFTNIFNSVSDMVFVLDNKGIILDVNTSAEYQLKYCAGLLTGKAFNSLQKGTLYFSKILKGLKNPAKLFTDDSVLYTSEGKIIPVHIKASFFKNEQHKQLVLLSISDISFQVQAENLIIRAIINTEEKERNRLAKDLHDDLAQQIVGIKFYISTAMLQARNIMQKEFLQKSNEALSTVISDIRRICFNLMPFTLQEFGLVEGIKEFCSHFLFNKITFTIIQNGSLPAMSPELEIDLYRVAQEFVNNASQHAGADKITINFSYQKGILKLQLADNGTGFNSTLITKGMGLQNVHSRIKSHNGILKIDSNNNGTSYKISIPIIKIKQYATK